MADEIKWIRMIVGMFDGNSFKKIKRAKIGGVSYRNVLTAVWFELLDLAAKCNANGYLIDKDSIPFDDYEDIATQIDREEKEVEICLNFFETEKMIEFVNGTYCIKNFAQYQNVDGLAQIRENNRLRQSKYREKKKQTLLGYPNNEVSRDSNVTSQQSNALEKELDKELDKKENTPCGGTKEKAPRFSSPTLEEVQKYCQERKNKVDPTRFWNFYESKGWMVGKTKMKDWKAAVRTWELEDRQKSTAVAKGYPPSDHKERVYTEEELKSIRRSIFDLSDEDL